MFVYSITNNITGKQYIGITTRTHDRFNKYWGSGKLIAYAIKKYGEENFIKEIIEITLNRDRLYDAERYWIRKLKTLAPNGYNMHPGGTHMTHKDEDTDFIFEDDEIVNKRIKNTIPIDYNWRVTQQEKESRVYWRNHRLKKHFIQNIVTSEIFELLGQDGVKNFVKEYNEKCFMTNMKLNWTKLIYIGKCQQFILLKSEKVYFV